MKNKLKEDLKNTWVLTIVVAIVLIIGMIMNLIFNNNIYTIKLIISCILKIIPIIIVCLIVDDLYRLNTKKYRKNKLLIESFLLVLTILGSISYDFNLASTILFLILISYVLLIIVKEFVER